jgi:hypothetical protein
MIRTIAALSLALVSSVAFAQTSTPAATGDAKTKTAEVAKPAAEAKKDEAKKPAAVAEVKKEEAKKPAAAEPKKEEAKKPVAAAPAPSTKSAH